MKREILFRGKDEKGGWHYGDLVINRPTQSFRIFSDFANVKHGNFTENGLHECSGELHLVIPDTVGQFTGLIDKNGNKIFDGDLLDFDELEWGGKFDPEPIFIETLINDGICGSLSDIKEWRKVIGNIHDNPDFLK